MRAYLLSLTALLTFALAGSASAETITVATYNIEHFESHFEGHRLRKAEPKAPPKPAVGAAVSENDLDKPPTPEEAAQNALSGPPEATKSEDINVRDLIESEKKHNDEDNWEVAEVITDDRFSPDVLVIEEGCDQTSLEYFNSRWLKKAYATAITFPTNTTRNQHLCMLLKPGFKVIERKDQYFLEKDTAGENTRGDRLFARGPAFCLIETPSGYRFWVGVTHQKSKFGNNLEVTRWRNRESVRTHQIMQELRKQGPADVMLLGDMNDELGMDEFEQQAGADSIALLVGPPADQFVLVTKPLIDAREESFGGYTNPRYRSFIDQIITTPEMKDKVSDVKVFRANLARVASDHYPVYVKVRADAPK